MRRLAFWLRVVVWSAFVVAGGIGFQAISGNQPNPWVASGYCNQITDRNAEFCRSVGIVAVAPKGVAAPKGAGAPTMTGSLGPPETTGPSRRGVPTITGSTASDCVPNEWVRN